MGSFLENRYLPPIQTGNWIRSGQVNGCADLKNGVTPVLLGKYRPVITGLEVRFELDYVHSNTIVSFFEHTLIIIYASVGYYPFRANTIPTMVNRTPRSTIMGCSPNQCKHAAKRLPRIPHHVVFVLSLRS